MSSTRRVERWDFNEFDVEDLLAMGRMLEDKSPWTDGETIAARLAANFLRVRDREGRERPLRANAAQWAFERARGRQNIVLKARQMGVTTWVSGRFFLKTITARGVLSVQVAQTREAAEGIFRMVQRFWECLPEDLREGPLRRSKSNVGQMVFPALDGEFRVVSAAEESAGRGLTIQNRQRGKPVAGRSRSYAGAGYGRRWLREMVDGVYSEWCVWMLL